MNRNDTAELIFDRPRENLPSLHLVMIVKISILKVLINFYSCQADFN